MLNFLSLMLYFAFVVESEQCINLDIVIHFQGVNFIVCIVLNDKKNFLISVHLEWMLDSD